MLVIVNVVQPDHTFTDFIIDYDLLSIEHQHLINVTENGGWIDFGEEDGYEDLWSDFEDALCAISDDMKVSKMLKSDCKIEKIVNMEY